jgi:RNA polymerase sigma-70 factor (ECF subfamily)
MSIPINLNNIDDDEVLIHLSKQKDKKAFTIIYNKYHQYLYALAYRYLKDSDMAEDAVQQVYVKLWEMIHVIDIEINLKNYLYSMTKNHILNQFRNNRETISISLMNAQQEIVDEEPGIESVIEETELSEMLQMGIENLPKQKKDIVKMKIEEHKSNQEIADEMGLSINTVKSHYQESIKMLRIYFKKIKLMFF